MGLLSEKNSKITSVIDSVTYDPETKDIHVNGNYVGKGKIVNGKLEIVSDCKKQ